MSRTVVDVVVSGTTATVVDARVDGVTTVAGAAPVTNVTGQVPDIGVVTNYITENITLTSDGFNQLSGGLVSTGQYLTDEIIIVSGLTTGSASDPALSGKVDTLSGNLIATGQYLTDEIIIVSGLTTGSSSDPALSGKVDTLSGNLIATGAIVDDISGNLIVTGQTLQTQITSNDSDISALTSNLITTGQTLEDKKFDKAGGIVSGNILPNATETLNLGSAAAKWDNLYVKDAHIDSSTLFLGTGGANIKVVNKRIQLQGEDSEDGAQFLGDAHIDGGTLFAQKATGPQFKILNTNVTNLYEFELDDQGHLNISGNLTGEVKFADPVTVEGSAVIKANQTGVFAAATNLVATGQTLTSEIAIVSGLTTGSSSDPALSGKVDTLSGNLITTGQTLTTDINTVSSNLISTGAVVDDISGNLITTGQTLTDKIIATGNDLDDDISTVSNNLVTTGQTLQTQITSNDSDISTLTSNLITTGQTLTDEIAIVSGIATGGSEQDFRDLSGNLIITGQTLTSEIGIVSGLTVTNLNNLVSTGSVVDDVSGNLITTGQTLTTNINTVSTNLIATGKTLTDNIDTVSSNLVSTGSIVDDISGNLATTGQTLQTQITSNDGDITTLTNNLVITGRTLTTNIDTVSANLVSTGKVVDDVSGNLITTGQTLQTQITSNDSDISTLTSNLVTTGQTLTTNINTVSSNLVSTGEVIDDVSGNLGTTGQTLQTQITSNDGDITTLTSNLASTGNTLDTTTVKLTTNQSIAGNKIFTNDVTINNLTVTGTEVIVDVENLAVKDNIIEINSGESGAGISRISGGIVIDRGSLPNANILYNDANDRFELNFPLAVEGGLVASAANLISTGEVVDDISGNLITTGQTLQTQITSNDSDISTLTSNLVTTGQTLTTNINTVSTNLISTGKVVDDISGNLITTGQTLQTQITSNDTDITNLSSNLVTTGQTLTTNINTVANNLVTTGQTLTSEIATVSGLIPATVIDGGGTANKVPLWSDANTIGDSVISQSSSKIGIGTATPRRTLHVHQEAASSTYLQVTNSSTGSGSDGQGFQFGVGSDGTANIVQRENLALAFLTNNAERIRILADGKVGIGTTAPSSISASTVALHIYGTNAELKAETNNGSGWAFTHYKSPQGSWTVGMGDSDKFRITNSASLTTSSALVIDTSGHVGIGVLPDGIGFRAEQSINGNWAGLIKNTHATNGHGLKVQAGDDSAVTSFRVANVSNTTLLEVLGDGNVGVGTASPTARLQINQVASDQSGAAALKVVGTAYGTNKAIYSYMGTTSNTKSLLYVENSNGVLLNIAGDGEIRVANQTLVDSANTNYKMTFPDNSGIAMGSAYTFANIYGSSGNLYLRANAYPANTGSTSIIYLQTSNASGGQASDVVVNNGNVGIGTTAPTSGFKLDVNGYTRTSLLTFRTSAAGVGGTVADENSYELGPGYLNLSRDDTAAARQIQFGKNGSLHSGIMTDTNGLNFVGSDGAADVTIKTDGNVGIGTNAPSELLHAYKTANAAVAISVQNPNTGNDARARVQLVSDGGTATLTTYSAAFATSSQNIADSALLRASSLSGGLGLSADGATPLHFWTNDTERMRILSDGKVGIGTGAPDRLLHIYKATAGSVTASSDAQLVVENSAIAAINLLSGSSSHGQILFGDAADNDDGQFGYDQTNREFYWKTAGSGNKALKVYANDNVTVEYGNIGIATTAPGAKLEVRGGSAAIPNLGAYGSLFNLRRADGHIGLSIDIDSATNNFWFQAQNSTSPVAQAIILNPKGGNVGIGTTTPVDTLHVYGAGTTAIFQSSSASGYIAIKETSGGNNVYLGNQSGLFVIQTPGSSYSTKFQVTSAGLVGIGIAPTSQLHVKATSGTAAIIDGTDDSTSLGSSPGLIIRQGDTNNDFSILKFEASGTGPLAMVGAKALTTGAYPNSVGELHFGVQNGSGTITAMTISGSNSGAVTIGAFTFPTADGSAGQVLQTNGSGTVTWATVSGGGGISGSGTDNYVPRWNGTTALQDSALFSDDNGNVGIGTDAPTQLLNVYQVGNSGNSYFEGAAKIGGNGAALGAFIGYNASASGYVNITNLNNSGGANSRIQFGFGAATDGTPATQVMTLNQAGNVGIGTDAPVGKLEVRVASETGSSSAHGIRIGTASNAVNIGASDDNYAWLQVRDADALSLQPVGGNVGIGTTAPGTLLHLRQYDTTGPTITMSNNPKTGYINWWGAAGGGTDRTDQFEINAVADGYGATIGAKTYIRFKTDGLGATDERMRIASDGKVGIGTNAPGAVQLDVRSTTVSGGSFDVQDSYTDITSGASPIWLSNSNQTNGNYIRINFADAVGGSSTALIAAKCTNHTSNYGDLQFWTRGSTGYGTRLHIDQEGGIGIGTEAPSANQKLDVNFADDVNGAGVTFRNTDGSLQFQNVAGSANQFNPQVKGNSKNVANVGLRLLGNAASGEDSGAVPLILLRGTVNNAKATTRPVLHIEDGDGGKLVAVAADGKVGIGTTAPSAGLEVAKTSADASFKVNRTDQTNIQLIAAGNSYVRASAALILQSNGANNRLTIAADGSSTFSGALTVGGALLPSANGTHNLGSSGAYWKNAYLEDTAINGTLYVGGVLTANAALTGTTATFYDSTGTGLTQASVLKLQSYTNAVEEGPFIDFHSRWNGSYPNWVLGRIGAVYETASGGSNEGALVFWTNNSNNAGQGVGGTTEKMRIQGNGYVGIGTTAPATKLDVRQSADDNGLRIYGYDDVSARYAELFVNSSGYTVLDASTDRGLVLKGHGIDFYINSGGTHAGRWTYDGKLGVGTTAPDYALDVRSSGATTLQVKSANNSDDTQLKLQSNAYYFNITNEGASGNITYVSDDAQDQIWYTDNASNASVERFRIKGGANVDSIYFSNSNVGIGTVAPGQLLHLKATLPVIKLESNNSQTRIDFYDGSTGQASIGVNDSFGDAFSIAVGGGSLTSDSKLVVKTDGNVGIGTTAPGGKLESYITGGGEKGLRLNSNFAGGNTVDFIPAIVGVSNAGFSIDLAGTNRLVINSSGNVGVGTNAPAAKLDVNGDVRIGNSTRGHYLGEKALTINGTTYTTALTIVLSDHNAAHVKIFLTGDWSSHSAVAYVGEYFIQNGAGGYAEPGMIISEFDNTHTDFIESKIVDPSTDTFTIQLKLSDSDNGTLGGHICYHVMGEVTSVT